MKEFRYIIRNVVVDFILTAEDTVNAESNIDFYYSVLNLRSWPSFKIKIISHFISFSIKYLQFGLCLRLFNLLRRI